MASMASASAYTRHSGARPATRAGAAERAAELLGQALIRWSSSRARRRELAMESHDRMLRVERDRAEREISAYRRWHLGA